MKYVLPTLIAVLLAAGGSSLASAEAGPCQEKKLSKKVACLNARLAKIEDAFNKAEGAVKQGELYRLHHLASDHCLQFSGGGAAPILAKCPVQKIPDQQFRLLKQD